MVRPAAAAPPPPPLHLDGGARCHPPPPSPQRTLMAVGTLPCGKPITVLSATPLPASRRPTNGTSHGRQHTDAALCSRATTHPASTSLIVISGRSSEWSSIPATSAAVRVVALRRQRAQLDR
jgi:hypothetical protein